MLISASYGRRQGRTATEKESAQPLLPLRGAAGGLGPGAGVLRGGAAELGADRDGGVALGVLAEEQRRQADDRGAALVRAAGRRLAGEAVGAGAAHSPRRAARRAGRGLRGAAAAGAAGGAAAADPCAAVGALRGGAPLPADFEAVADPRRGVQREL